MIVVLALEIEREPTNEVEDDAWYPLPHEVATVVREHYAGRDLDTGWIIRSVTPGTR